MKHQLLPALLALSLLAAACGGRDTSGPIPPPTFYFGEDLCAECSMIISEQRFAGAIGLREGKRLKHLLFDDIGEMFEYALPAHDEVSYFVHDLETSACIEASSAYFVRCQTLRTPMGTGVAAFASEDARDATLAEYPGEKLTLAQLRGGR